MIEMTKKPTYDDLEEEMFTDINLDDDYVDSKKWYPEQKLAATLLFRGLRSKSPEDQKWIESDCTRICSFLWCCEIMDLDPTYVRFNLKNLICKRHQY